MTLIALSGCASVDMLMGPAPAVLADKAQTQFSAQNYSQASVLYQRAAQRAQEPQRSRYYLEAARAAVRVGDTKLALGLLKRVDASVLGAEGRAKKVLITLRAQIAGMAPEKALQKVAPPGPTATPSLAAGIWKLRAELLFRAGRIVDGVHALVQRHIWLLNPKIIKQNSQHIWRKLQAAERARHQPESGARLGRTTRGWLELARISKQDWPTTDQLHQALDIWAQRYPGHPAGRWILADAFGYTPDVSATTALGAAAPGAIGVALPLSGDLAGAAQAILDGFLAAYYQQRAPRPDLQIYDTQSLSAGASVVARAAAEGVSILVGPLTKTAVGRLATKSSLPIPVLALNYTNKNHPPPALYQYGLSPEDEARAVARRAAAMGWLKALVLVPRGDWGTRVLSAFQQTLTRAGGTLIEYAYFNSSREDHATAIKQLLNYGAGGGNLKRADFIFIAAQPMQARLLRTQLRFFGATNIPVLATSHLYNKASNGERHGDLDGVMFTDMPWMLGTHHADTRKRELSDPWATATGGRARLFAMGLDAWALAHRLRQQSLQPGTLFQGATGKLYLERDGQIRRLLDWAKFVHGQSKGLPPRDIIRLRGRNHREHSGAADPGKRTRNPPGPIGPMPEQGF